jgi:hypothetical protein
MLQLMLITYSISGITVWLSALFLVKEENAQGDLSEGETVKVRLYIFPLRTSTPEEIRPLLLSSLQLCLTLFFRLVSKLIMAPANWSH